MKTPPRTTESSPERPSIHSFEISWRNRIAEMICRTPVTIIHAAMTYISASAETAGPGHDEDTGHDPGEADQDIGPPSIMSIPRLDARPDFDDAVDEGVCAEQDHQDEDRQAGPNDSDDAEHDGGDAAEQQHPPVLAEGAEQALQFRRILSVLRSMIPSHLALARAPKVLATWYVPRR